MPTISALRGRVGAETDSRRVHGVSDPHHERRPYRPGTVGEGVLANERDNLAVAKAFGMKKAYDLYYRNHMLDSVSPLELRLRLIFLFRLLKVDTVICYDPWAHYEENPDHYATASAVEAACWMSGMSQGLSGTLRRGPVAPLGDGEVLFCARSAVCQSRSGYQRLHGPEDLPQYPQRGSRTGRPAGGAIATPTDGQGLRLPLLGNDDETANREYTRQFVLDRDAETGKKFGLAYGEAYHYIGPPPAKSKSTSGERREATPKTGFLREIIRWHMESARRSGLAARSRPGVVAGSEKHLQREV